MEELEERLERYLTSDDVMAILRISRSTFNRMLDDNRLKGYKPLGCHHWLFKEDEVRQVVRRVYLRPLPQLEQVM